MNASLLERGSPSAASAAAGAEAATAAAAPRRNSRLSIKAPSLAAFRRFARCLTQIVRNEGKPAPITGSERLLAPEPSREEAAQLRPGSRSGVVVVGQRHAQNLFA